VSAGLTRAAAVLVGVAAAAPVSARGLDAADVARIIGQAVSEAHARGRAVSIAVVDHEGNVLGTLQMPGAPGSTVLRGGGPRRCQPPLGPPGCGLEGAQVPALAAAESKAGTAAFLSTQGHAFTTRTAGFIIQPHFPPQVENASSGPLFGVQFSQLPCGDVVPPGGPTLPLGMSADPGGVPLYKRGHAAGGVGIEGDGRYAIDLDPTARDVTDEERIAVAAAHGYGAPRAIRGDQILVGGLRLPFVDAEERRTGRVATFAPGANDVPPRAAPPTRFVAGALGGVRGTVDPRYFPPRQSVEPPVTAAGLTGDDVRRILTRAARQADQTRAAIRVPIGDRARVNIAVVDRGGNLLGLFRTRDAPVFGFDVCVQKARTAAFWSSADAAARLRAAGHGAYVEAAAREGLRLDGAVAFSDRAGGFLSRPLFPDGIDATRQGPFSVPIAEFSVFNDGLQEALVEAAVRTILGGGTRAECTGIAGLGNGIQIFPGSVPLYRGRTLVGAVGVSGDGVDQDDLVASAGSRGFEAPADMRADRVFVRDVRLPYVKFPRRPTTR
jgi:uncharacterized protein GlcG (DUF336 family)